MFCPMAVVVVGSISKTKIVFNQNRTRFLLIALSIARAIDYCFASEANEMLMTYYMHPLQSTAHHHV